MINSECISNIPSQREAEICDLLSDRSTNLCRREKALNALIPTLDADDIQKLIPVIAELANKAAEIKAQKAWLELGFSEALLETDADSVYFLIRSGFAYHMHLFSHDIIDRQILVEGEYKPLHDALRHLMIDYTSGKVVSREMRESFYNYIATAGIVQKNPNPSVLYPIAKVEPRAECALQIVTTLDRHFESVFTEGLNELLPHHSSLRLIDKEGNLYSFGLQVAKEHARFMDAHEHSYTAQGMAWVSVPDFRETRPFYERYITTLPISEEALSHLLLIAGKINEEGGCAFTITGKNCNYFVVSLLQEVGIDIDTHITLGDAAIRTVPYVGKVFEPFYAQIPDPIKKIGTPLTNGLIAFFGGGTGYYKIEDFFDDEKAELYHPYKLIDWQKKHTGTQYVPATRCPKLCNEGFYNL